MKRLSVMLALGLLAGFAACSGDKGATGAPGPAGEAGAQGDPGAPAAGTGSITGTVKDANQAPIAGVAVATIPDSKTATTDAQGAFTLADIPTGSYSVTASKASYAPYTLPPVGVAAKATTSVNLVLSVDSKAPSTVSGTVTDSKDSSPTPIANAKVEVEGQNVTTTTDAQGKFTLANVAPGPIFLLVTPPDLTKFLPGELRSAVMVSPATTVAGVSVVLSARQSDNATYVGMQVCSACHGQSNTKTGNMVGAVTSSAHNRSLWRVPRDNNGAAQANAFARVLNPTLASPRTVMIPLAGTIAVSGATVTGTGTSFTSLQLGDKIGYTPKGLGWTQLGVVQTIASDTQIVLGATATFAPGVTSLGAGTAWSVQRLSSNGHTHLWPEDSSDIVAPSWPGVKATNPNYDANDPCVYGPPQTTCAAGGNVQYADGQVNVYLCNLKGSTVQGVTYANDEYVQKFGGSPWTCSDGTFWDGVNTPAVPMVHIDVVYGGQGDKDGSMQPHQNLGVFKQRYQGHMADVKAVSGWTPAYTSNADRDRDSLTLPIQLLESGDKTNGAFKLNGYHPTEQKFPNESWSQRTRTFSHACAGCHATGLAIAFDMQQNTVPFPVDNQISKVDVAAIKTFTYQDENITCEHCHGPGSEHAGNSGGRANAIINPKFLTADGERQVCGKCHAYDSGQNAKPAQTYGFEYPWNTDWSAKVGGGNFVAGVYDIKDAFANWDERLTDDETFWDPSAMGGKLYGHEHRQQYVMLSESVHANNPYIKPTCATCHDAHTTFKGSTTVQSKTDTLVFKVADYRDNALCLSCHAGGGPLSYMSGGPFGSLTKDDVIALQISTGGAVTKNGVAVPAPKPDDIATSLANIASAVGQHMLAKAQMGNALYDPMNEALPTGRCTSCHMPKVAKSGGYTNGTDYLGNDAVIEGDQGSHAFDIIWPAQANAMGRAGPTFQSGYVAQAYGPSNTTKYDKFNFIPNSCSKCHPGARRATFWCPDTSAVWPAYWPFTGPANPNMAWAQGNCFTSKNAP